MKQLLPPLCFFVACLGFQAAQAQFTVSGPETLCKGSSATLTAANCGGALRWSTGETTASITVSPAATTTYYVTCTVGSASTTGSLSPVVVPGLQLNSNVGTCLTDQATLSVPGVPVGSTLRWERDGVLIPGAGSNNYTATQPGTYTVKSDSPTAAWTWQNLLPDGEDFNDIFFPTDFIGVAVGNYGKIVRTTDGGQTWTKIAANESYDFTSVHFVDSTTGWLIGRGGQLLKTTDAGLTWNQRYLGGAYSGLNEIFFTDPDHGWITDSNFPNVLRTTDGGVSWQVANHGAFASYGLHFTDNSNGWIVGTEVRRTTDGGATWSAANVGNGYLTTDVFFVDASTGWIVGNGNTIYKTTNGGSSWISLSSLFPANTSFSGVFFSDENNGVLLSSRGLYKTSSGGNSWTLTDTPTIGAQSVFMRSPSRAWVAGKLGRLLTGYATPSSYAWKVTRGEGIGSEQNGNIQPAMDFVSASVGWAVNGTGFLLKTTNGGKVWTNTPLKEVYDVDFIDANVGFATAKGTGPTPIVLYKSIDGGNSWNPLYNFPSPNPVKVQFVNSSVGWAYVSYFGQEVYRTTDGGLTWNSSALGFRVTNLFFLDNANGWVSGTDGRVAKTTDGGLTWTDVNTGTQSPNYNISQVYFKDSNVGWITGSSTRKTTDGGQTWSANVINGNIIAFRSISFSDANHGIALSHYYRHYNGGYIYYLTSDGGNTWTPQRLPSSDPFNTVILTDAANAWVTNGQGGIMHYAAPTATCAASITLRQSPPAPTVTASTHNSLCEGESITLTASGCPDAPRWSDGSTGSTITVTPYASTTYTAFCDGGNGCQSPTYAGVAVIPKVRLDTVSVAPCNRPVLTATNFWPGIDIRWLKDGQQVQYQHSNSYQANSTYLASTSGTYTAVPDAAGAWSPQTGALGIDFFTDVDFATPSVGLAVGASGYILKSNDGGTSWRTLSSGTFSYLGKVKMPTPETGWAFGGTTTLKTTDGGATWVKQNMGGIGSFSYMSFFDQNIGWAINGGNLYHTTDNGVSWISQNIAGANNYLSINAVGASTAWVTTLFKVYKTTDGGASWIEVNVGNNGLSLGSAAYFSDANHGWVAGENSPSLIYHTADGGATWNTQNPPQFGYSSIDQIQFIDNENGWLKMNGRYLLMTSDGGQNWSLKSDLNSTGLGSIGRFYFTSAGSGVITGNRLVARTTDSAATWQKASGNLPSFTQTDLTDVHFIDNDKGFVVGRNKLLLSTANGGKNWAIRTLEFGDYSEGYDIFFVSATHGWILGGGIVLRTTDGGASWSRSPNRVNAYAQIFFTNNEVGWAPGYKKVSKTTDGGITWTEQAIPDGDNLQGVFFVDSNRGWVTGGGRIFNTTDGGSTWTQQYANNSFSLNSVYFTSSTEGWATGAPLLLHTTDGGNTWQTQTIEGASGAYFSKVQFVNDSVGFVRGTQVIYITTDRGATWKKTYQHGNNSNLGLHFTDATHGWLVGGAGILAYHPAAAPCSSATIVVQPSAVAPLSTLASGDWDTPGVWSCGTVPTALDAVRIDAEHTITLPEGYSAKAKSVELRGNLVPQHNAGLQMGQD